MSSFVFLQSKIITTPQTAPSLGRVDRWRVNLYRYLDSLLARLNSPKPLKPSSTIKSEPVASSLSTDAWLVRQFEIIQKKNPQEIKKLNDLLSFAREKFVPYHLVGDFGAKIEYQHEIKLSSIVRSMNICGERIDEAFGDKPSYNVSFNFEHKRKLNAKFAYDREFKRFDLQISNASVISLSPIVKDSLELLTYIVLNEMLILSSEEE